MDRTDYSDWNCSVARTLDLVGDRWTILILREAFFGVRRFDALQRNLGIARNVLADRLGKLVANGIMERRRYQERPARHEYRLTERGHGLYAPLVALMRWGDEYLAEPEGPPVVLHHLTCDHDATPVMSCSHCRAELDPHDVRATPGPGATAVAPSGAE